jgi:CBS domain-containing protein
MKKEKAMQTVAEIMTRDVQSVAPQDSLRRAAQLMDELNVGALPVCEGGRLVGIVTDRDITVRGTSVGMAPEQAHVDQVMSADVRSCHEDEAIDEVLQRMGDVQVRRIPVLSREGGLIGMVSLGDIATRAQGREVGHTIEQVSTPSEPDRSPVPGNGSGNASGAANGNASGAAAGITGGEVRASSTGTASGLLGSDVLADRMNPGVEVSSTGDPSDTVEVQPDELVNRNAPGSRIPNTPDGAKQQQQEGVTVRHVAARGGDTSTGESGAPEGTDAAGASGASGGTAGTAGSAGTGVGAGQQG